MLADRSVNLPQELTDIIIDFLHSDLETLRSCSVVHSSWVRACRRHLYAAVTFRTVGDLQSWTDVFPSAPSLHNPARYVRSLTLLEFRGLDLNNLDQSFFRDFQTFNRVEHLCHSTLTIPPTLLLPGFYAQVRSSVNSLELHLSSATKVTDLLHFICSFPSLEDLTLTGTGCWLEQSEGDTVKLPSLPPFTGALRLLKFNDSNGEFLTKFADLPSGIRFQFMELDIDPLQEYISVSRLLLSCGSTLEVLKLGNSFAGPSTSHAILHTL